MHKIKSTVFEVTPLVGEEMSFLPIYKQMHLILYSNNVSSLQVFCSVLWVVSSSVNASPPGCDSTLAFSSDVASSPEGNGNIHSRSLSPWSWRSVWRCRDSKYIKGWMSEWLDEWMSEQFYSETANKRLSECEWLWSCCVVLNISGSWFISLSQLNRT